MTVSEAVPVAQAAPVGPAQRQFAGHFELVHAAGGDWLAFPAGRHGHDGGSPPALSVCLIARDCSPELDAQLAQARALAPAGAQIILVAGQSIDWTVAIGLRAAMADERVTLYQPTVAGRLDALAAAALRLSTAPLALIVPVGAQLRGDLLAVLGRPLAAAPAVTAAVGCAGEAFEVRAPWCGAGYRHGADAAAAAAAAPVETLLGCPALIRTAALPAVAGAGARGATLRELLAAACAAGDVVGVPETLSMRARADRPAPDPAPEDAGPPAEMDAAVPFAASATAAPRAAAGAAAALTCGPVDLRRYRPGVTPRALDLGGRRFVCAFAWDGHPPAGLEDVVRSYLSAFADGDPVSLLLWPDTVDAPVAGAIEAWLVGLISGALNRSVQDIPDIAVQAVVLDEADRPAVYAAVHYALVLPGGATSAREALACGVPVIGTPVGDLATLLTDATGFPARHGDLVGALCAAVSDPDEAVRRGAGARARVLRPA